MTILDLLFYVTLVPYYVATYHVLKRCVPVFSLSGLFLILNFIFIVIPGYFNYRGGVTYDVNSQIDDTAYVLYLLQALIPPLAVYASWRLSGPPLLRITRRLGIKPIYTAVLLAVIAYDIVYIVANRQQIPLVGMFTGDLDAISLARSELTHGFSDTDAPWYFAYYRVFTKDLIFLLAIPLFLYGRFWRSLGGLIGFGAVAFLLLMHAEKAYLLFLVLAVYLAQSDFRPPSLKTVFAGAIAIFVLSVLVTYALFAETFTDALTYLPNRLSAQTGYVVSQLQVAEQYGFLGIRGVRLGILNRALSIDYVDISTLTFNEVHSGAADAGLTGSSAGASMAELYMSAGYVSPLIYVIAIYLLAQLDKNLRTFATDFSGAKDFEARLARSLYIYFVCFYSLEPVTSVFGVFSLASVFQPSLLLAVLLFLLFFRVSIRRTARGVAAGGPQ